MSKSYVVFREMFILTILTKTSKLYTRFIKSIYERNVNYYE